MDAIGLSEIATGVEPAHRARKTARVTRGVGHDAHVSHGCCERYFSPRHTIGGRCYCVRNMYPRINAITLAKISSAGIDFRIVCLVEWRAADRLD